MRELVHFAHGNGFPSPCYRQLLTHVQERFDCCYIDRIGHSPFFPVTEHWHCLIDEIIHSIQSQAKQPVIALGHSLGGVLSVLAAIEQPELFKGVILLDSPLIGRIKTIALRFSKYFGLIDHVTPAFRTKARQRHWHTREQAFSYLKSRALFKTFTDACLHDYIDFGMQQEKDGYSLRFDPQIEYQIYRTIPHSLARYEGRLRVPTVLIYGGQSTVVDNMDRRYMKKKYGITCVRIEGTHMFPMEAPKEVAHIIMEQIEYILKGEVDLCMD